MKLIEKIWNDPVGSKVISGIILAILGSLASRLDYKKMKDSFIGFWTIKIELWKYFLILIFFFIAWYILNKVINP